MRSGLYGSLYAKPGGDTWQLSTPNLALSSCGALESQHQTTSDEKALHKDDVCTENAAKPGVRLPVVDAHHPGIRACQLGIH